MDESKGVYTEKINTEATLTVTKDGWKIKYVFWGPDLRYNPSYLNIDETYIDTYILSLKNNFEKYNELKETTKFSSGQAYELEGEDDMIIKVGDWDEGVRVHPRSIEFIRNEDDVKKFIKEYKYCKKRARDIQKMLNSL